MRRLTFLVLFCAAIYSGYWFVGARAVKAQATTAITDAHAAGWAISYSALNTRGFPSRFDTTINDVVLTPPDGAWAWDAPFLQIFALSYQPNKVIAAFPNEQSLRVGPQMLAIQSEGLRASAAVKVNTNLSFDATTVELDEATVKSEDGWDIALGRTLLAMRAGPEKPDQYAVYLSNSGLRLPAALIQDIDPGNVLTDRINNLVLDGTLTFDQPLDRHANAPLLQRLAVKQFTLDWGTLSVTAEGAIDVDSAGVPNGRITLTTDDWRVLIDLLAHAQVIRPGMVLTVTNMAQTMALGGQTLELPISFQNGFMSLGPLPLGPAPRFH